MTHEQLEMNANISLYVLDMSISNYGIRYSDDMSVLTSQLIVFLNVGEKM